MNIINISRIKSQQYVNLKESKSKKQEDDSEILDSENIVQEDKLTISEEAKETIKEKRELMLEEVEENLHLIEHFKEEMKAFNEDENPYTVELKCLLISLRIINGDEVPQKDKNFLMENKPEMYGNAILLRRINSEPKKHKSLLEDDKEDIEELSMESQELLSELSTEASSPTNDNSSPED